MKLQRERDESGKFIEKTDPGKYRTVRLPLSMILELNKIAENESATISDTIREAIAYYLKNKPNS